MANPAPYGVDSRTGRGPLVSAADVANDPELAAYLQLKGVKPSGFDAFALGVPKEGSHGIPLTGGSYMDRPRDAIAASSAAAQRADMDAPSTFAAQMDKALTMPVAPAPKKRTKEELKRARSKKKDVESPAPNGADIKLDENGEPIPSFTNAAPPESEVQPTFTAAPGGGGALASANGEGLLAPAVEPEKPKPPDGLTLTEEKKSTLHQEKPEAYRQAEVADQDLAARRTATEEKARALGQEEARANVNYQEEVGKVQEQHQAELAKIDAEAKNDITNRQQRVEALVSERAKASKFTDLIDRASGGQKLLMAIGLALGGIGAGLKGGRNEAFDALMLRVQQDRELQAARLDAMDGNIAMEKTGLNDAVAAKAKLKEDAAINSRAVLEKLETTLKKNLAQQGVSAADIASDQRIQAIEAARIAAQKQDALQFADKVQEETERKRLVLQQGAKNALLGVAGKVRQDIKSDADLAQLTDANTKIRAYTQMQARLANAVKENNPKALQATLTEVMRIANGGVLSDAERAQMVTNSGGFLQQLKDKSIGFREGFVSPETVRNFAGMIAASRKGWIATAHESRNAFLERASTVDPTTGQPIYPPVIIKMLVPNVADQPAGGAAAPAGGGGQVGMVTLKDGRRVRARKNADGSIDILEGG